MAFWFNFNNLGRYTAAKNIGIKREPTMEFVVDVEL